MTAAATTAGDVRRALRDRTEIALLDVRPEARFAEGHPLFAASFPLGRLEIEAFDRLPRRSVPIVVYGDGADATTALQRLRSLGYPEVSALAGGLAGWDGELFRDVNAPSKAFGELVEACAGTPAMDPAELSARLGRDVVVLDARRFEEYHTMSIPTATSVPGAELVLRAGALARPDALIVVNCAGRTRSIIGAQSLINAGLRNVVALRNGTIGWTLAGLTLERGQQRRAPDVPATQARRARMAARAVARKAGVRHISRAEVRLAAKQRTVYRFDVRSPGEYAAGHLPGFRPAPGGQLVQETDWFAPVRGALVVLAEDTGGRAAMTASWLAQMGWEVVLLRVAGRLVSGPWQPTRPALPGVPLVGPDELDTSLRAGRARLIDIDTSRQFLAGHIPGAAWALRSDLPCGRLVLTSEDGTLAAFAAAEVGGTALAGGTAGWAASGRPLQAGQGEMLSAPEDVYRRPYEGTGVDPAAMRAYLDWEYGLVAQLERDGTHGFTVLT
jgi:rhodanese-related sulfurtransferase